MSILFNNPLLGASGSGGAAADLGDTIEQSLRFRGGQRLVGPDPRPSGDFTVSFWFKLGQVSTETMTFLSFTGNQSYQLRQDVLTCRRSTSNDQLSNGVIRDPSAWYHAVYVNDGGTTTLHLNGVEQTNSHNTPNGGDDMTIGSNSDTFMDNPLIAYLADYHFIDGQTLQPTAFGRTNDDGVWVPDTYTGSYGTNGFHLTFDSSQANGIGHDSSGNSNHFTASGFNSTSSSIDYDLDFEDTPTNNYATLNPLNNGTGNDPTNANLEFNSTTTAVGCITATQAVSSGKWYWEVDVSGLGSANSCIGVRGIDDADRRTTSLANLSNDFVYLGTGDSANNGSVATYGASYTTNDVVGIALDLDAGEIEFFKNNSSQGVAYTGLTGSFVPAIGDLSTGSVFTGDIDFGQKPFEYSAPAGYSELSLNNAPEPTIKNGKEHFDVVTYTGNGSTQSITGLEFQPDFVWLKARNVGYHNRLFDVIRGQSSLVSDDDRVEGTSANSSLTSFDSNGFSITQTVDESYNQSTKTYVAWCWKAGGTAVSNTDGTITSSVSANTDAGFSIVSWTGTNAVGTVGHGLDSPPEWILVKNRDDASTNWRVYHIGTTATDPEDHYLHLNTTAAAANDNVFNDTKPTASVFSLAASNEGNGSGDSMIAYCWHSVEGYSKFGSYTGNGSSTDGPFVYTGFEVHWLLVKRTNAATNWVLYDTKREPVNPNDVHLFANLTNAENTSTSFNVDLLSNGFKIRGNTSNINASGGNYIYMAFGAHPFGGENAPPATAR